MFGGLFGYFACLTDFVMVVSAMWWLSWFGGFSWLYFSLFSDGVCGLFWLFLLVG